MNEKNPLSPTFTNEDHSGYLAVTGGGGFMCIIVEPGHVPEPGPWDDFHDPGECYVCYMDGSMGWTVIARVLGRLPDNASQCLVEDTTL